MSNQSEENLRRLLRRAICEFIEPMGISHLTAGTQWRVEAQCLGHERDAGGRNHEYRYRVGTFCRNRVFSPGLGQHTAVRLGLSLIGTITFVFLLRVVPNTPG